MICLPSLERCDGLTLQAIRWISELCDVLTKTQLEALQPNADVDALHADQQKFEETAKVPRNLHSESRVHREGGGVVSV